MNTCKLDGNSKTARMFQVMRYCTSEYWDIYDFRRFDLDTTCLSTHMAAIKQELRKTNAPYRVERKAERGKNWYRVVRTRV